MRFVVSQCTGTGHSETVTAVSWDGSSLVSGSDDQTVQRWSASGQHNGQVVPGLCWFVVSTDDN